MKRTLPAMALPLALLLPLVAAAVTVSPVRPVSTYSIVARDPETGDLGVAVQSHWFSVGSLVPWAQAGVGAVATQSMVEPAYGRRGLALMKTGAVAAAAPCHSCWRPTSNADIRQVAMVDGQRHAWPPHRQPAASPRPAGHQLARAIRCRPT